MSRLADSDVELKRSEGVSSIAKVRKLMSVAKVDIPG